MKRAIILGIIFAYLLTLRNVLAGTTPFWYDLARDLLMAVANLEKPTLIGATSGIPGIFYGPHWIWWLSLGAAVTRNPRWITLLTLTLPYFIFFPWLLLKFRSVASLNRDETKSATKVYLLLWLLFLMSYNHYVTSLWSPHPAPVMILAIALAVMRLKFIGRGYKSYFRAILIGFLAGVTITFQFSLGIGIFLATGLYIFLSSVVEWFSQRKTGGRWLILRQLAFAPAFFLGGLIAYLPFFIFEFRHGFNQIGVIWRAVTDPASLSPGAIGQVGLVKSELVPELLKVVSTTFQLPVEVTNVLLLALAGLVGYRLAKGSLRFSSGEKKLLAYLGVCVGTVMLIFLTAKNPVWAYHFIGFETLLILVLALVVSKLPLVRLALVGWIGWLFLSQVPWRLLQPVETESMSGVATKEGIVNQIYQDSEGKPLAVFAYSPAIYTFDFDYLFSWLGESKWGYWPETDLTKVDQVYLIIPETSIEIKDDFINYRTPNDQYQTAKTWDIPDGTTVIKRTEI